MEVLIFCGRGGWSWSTGSASWYYICGIEYILGLKIEEQKLADEKEQFEKYKEVEEAKITSDGRPYHSVGSIMRSIQEGAAFMAEQYNTPPQLRFNPETGLEDDDEPLGEPNQDEWGFMDDDLAE